MSIINTGLAGSFLKSLTVTPERLLEQASAAQRQIRQMQQAFQNLANCVSKTKGYWIGEAGDAHREYYTSRKDEIQTVFARLDEDVSNLKSMAAVYSQVEQAVAAIAEDLPADVIV